MLFHSKLKKFNAGQAHPDRSIRQPAASIHCIERVSPPGRAVGCGHPYSRKGTLTYAQRTASALERAGITAHIMRSPKSIAGEGCSHSVKVSQRNLPDALRILHRTELDPRRVYITAGDGSYKEVQL